MPLYLCVGPLEARRVVSSTLFHSMRWMYWYEIAEALRYVDINAVGIDRALLQLTAEGRVERRMSGDGRYIYRTVMDWRGV